MKPRYMLGSLAILAIGGGLAWQYSESEVAAFWRKYVVGSPLTAGATTALPNAQSANTAAPNQRSQRPPTAVGVAKATVKDVPIVLRTIGTVQPHASVLIKSRVDGALAEVHVKEGQMVKEGDRLFSIDPRSFEAQLKQAEANLARDRAQLENAKQELSRTERTVQQGAQSQKALDLARANVATLEAAIKSGEAAIELSKVQLSYTRIVAPISGRAGDVRITQGNLVKNNDATPLLTINQLRPINVTFTVPEKYLPEIRARHNKAPLEVGVTDNRAVLHPERGKLVFIDNTIDTNTGTIALKAEFANDKDLLWPGQFVQVDLKITVREQAVTVPVQAVQSGQRGSYVYVAKGAIAEYRPVKVGPLVGDDAVIEEGVAGDEVIIVDGHLRLGPNAPIVIRTPGPAPSRAPGAAPPGGPQGSPSGAPRDTTPEKRS